MKRFGGSERASLEKGLEPIRPLLEARGFACTQESQGSSSGGPFASVCFRRGELEIGFIVRHWTGLGTPNYTGGKGYVGHEDIIWALGQEGNEQLVQADSVSSRSRRGGDPFEALRSDLEQIIFPALDRSEAEFLASLARALRHLRKRRGW